MVLCNLVLVILVICVNVFCVCSMVIESQASTIQVVNGQQFELDTVTAILGPSDENVPQSFIVSDAVSGDNYTVTVNAPAPSYIYSHILKGWIPVYQQCFKNILPLLMSPSPTGTQPFGSPIVGGSTQLTQTGLTTFNAAFQKPPVQGVSSSPTYLQTTNHRALGVPTMQRNTAKRRRSSQVRQSWIERPDQNDRTLSRQIQYTRRSIWGTIQGAYEGFYCHLGFHMNDCGGPDYQSEINAQESQIKLLNTSVNNIEQQQQKFAVWENSANSALTLLGQSYSLVQEQASANRRAIGGVISAVSQLNQVTYNMQIHYQAAFDNISADLTELSNATESVYNYTRAVASVSNSQLLSLFSISSYLSQNIAELATLVDFLSKSTIPRRRLIFEFWNETINYPSPLPVCPFIQCIGFAPVSNGLPEGESFTWNNEANCPVQNSACLTSMNTVPGTNQLAATPAPAPTQLSTLQSLQYAAQLAVVRLQYTANGMATERQLSFICDKVYFLNNFMPDISQRDLIRFMGPPPINGSYCYDTADPFAPAWNCSCVIVQQTQSCTLNTSAPMFPFGWQPTPVLAGSSQLSTYCTTPIATTVIQAETATVIDQIDTVGAIYSNYTNWVQFAETLCQQSVADWQAYSDGRNLRIASDASGGYVDMTLTSANLVTDCNADVSYILAMQSPLSNMYYQVYSLFVTSYDLVGFVYQAVWEQQVFGILPTGPTITESPFVSRPDIITGMSQYTMTTATYAGTGIDVLTLPYPDPFPDESLVSATYPPSPNLGVPPTPNTNKVPVYYISPVEESYVPVITIQKNGGTPAYCQFNGSTCQVGMETGLNFSTALAVSLTSEWSNLLPGERFIIGDYSVDLNTQQVLYDIPAAAVPNINNIQGLCNTLLYLFQPRSSPFVNDTLFNIPDTDFTIPINADDWVNFYQNQFDSNCACANLMSYARTVDALGQCVGGVNPDGSANPNVPNPGNSDMCTLLQAFRVNVPNYVSAFMKLSPLQYSVKAVFQIPKGEVIQYTSTSCPSGYQIIVPSNSSADVTEAVFTTTSASLQKITIQIVQFNDSFICGPIAPYTVSYSQTVPAVYSNIPKCGVQYINVFPYLSNAPCYPYPGLEMYAATSSASPPVVPSSTVTFVNAVADSTYSALVDLVIQSATLQAQIQYLKYYFGPTSAQQLDAAQQIAAQSVQTISRMNVSGVTEPAQKAVQEAAYKSINQSLTNATQDIAVSESASKQAHVIFLQLNATLAQVNEANNKSIEGAALLAEQMAKYNANFTIATEQFNKAKNAGSSNGVSNSCSVSWIPFLGSLLCEIDAIFRIILGVIMWIIIVLVILYLFKSGCCKEFGHMLTAPFQKKKDPNAKKKKKNNTKTTAPDATTGPRYHHV